jgi:hypothetical protein
MGNKFLRYGFGAIVVYLGVFYATGAGTLVNAGASGVATDVKAFQGR